MFGANKLALDKVQGLSQWSGTTHGIVMDWGLHPPGSLLSGWSLLCGIGWSWHWTRGGSVSGICFFPAVYSGTDTATACDSVGDFCFSSRKGRGVPQVHQVWAGLLPGFRVISGG